MKIAESIGSIAVLFLLLITILPPGLSDMQSIIGRVIEGDRPVAGALVRMQATTISDISD